MNSLRREFTINGSENIDKQLSPSNEDRFARRLNKYRHHQSDCQMKNDCSVREKCEQESLHVRILQSQPKKAKKITRKKKAVRENFETIFESILTIVILAKTCVASTT